MKKKTEDRRQKTGDRRQKTVGRADRTSKKYLTQLKTWSLAFTGNPPFSVSPGPRNRLEHLAALSAKIQSNHKALVQVATGIVNLKRKLRRQEEIYRSLALNYGARNAEHIRQLAETSANS